MYNLVYTHYIILIINTYISLYFVYLKYNIFHNFISVLFTISIPQQTLPHLNITSNIYHSFTINLWFLEPTNNVVTSPLCLYYLLLLKWLGNYEKLLDATFALSKIIKSAGPEAPANTGPKFL